ncbi:winged helix-turn-helix domain-containing protein, partial [Enterococcus haemoperoxidus]
PMERLIYLQLGATIVFDNQIKPNEFGIIVSNLLQPRVGLRQAVLEEKVGSGLQLNVYNHSIRLENEQEVLLTPLEYKLVSYLKSKKEQGATYEEIYQVLWQQEMGNQRYRVANLVFLIRTKIEKSTAHPKYLKTIR